MDDARHIMTEYRDQWSTLAEGLLEYETLSGQEIKDLLEGKPPSRPDEPDEPQGPTSFPLDPWINRIRLTNSRNSLFK